MAEHQAYRIAIVGSGPAGLAAAARAAAARVPHVLLEAESHLSNTIHRYQKGKHVMCEPGVLPLRADLPFAAGRREQVLQGWRDGTQGLGVNVRHGAEVTAISGSRGDFRLTLAGGETIVAQAVVLAIGLQGNLRKLGCPGEDLDFVQYQLDDPDEYRDETIVIVGAGDAAIENAIALSEKNRVYILNRRDEFDRAKPANNAAILKAIEDGRLQCIYNCGVSLALKTDSALGGLLKLSTAQGEMDLPCSRVIARLGATPPRKFVESCGIQFPSKDPNAVPAVSPQYESNVPGLYIVGALAGFPLIKQAMNQGYEVVEFIEGRRVEPADAPLLREKFAAIRQWREDPEAALDSIRRRVPVLEPLTPLQLREFLLDSNVHTPAQGEVLFRRNDYSTSFYSIVSGEVEIEIDAEDPGKRVKLGMGEFFGEMSLISGRRRAATVHAGPHCVVIETPRRSMNKLIASVAAVKRVVDEAFLRRALQARLAAGLTADDLQELVQAATLKAYKPEELLFKEGDPGDALYLIRRGSVTVSRQIGGRDVVLAYVPAGQYVGEMALVNDLPRSATARAAVATETIRLDGEVFKNLMARRTSIRHEIQEVSKGRMAQNAAGQDAEHGSVISFMMAQGLGEATDVLLIDETLCVRCNQCEKACADTHGNLSRLKREAGPSFDTLHVPTSCRHCEHPHCMKECPPDAIHRGPGGEVYITDACIGCGNCERNCPYGVIQMGVQTDKTPSLWRWMLFGGTEPGSGILPKPRKGAEKPAKKAAKCDMCKDQDGGPACVRACPTGAALRVSPEEFLDLARRGSSA